MELALIFRRKKKKGDESECYFLRCGDLHVRNRYRFEGRLVTVSSTNNRFKNLGLSLESSVVEA